jgi:radical SAM superfamily enzyme YgiQ (UPF0313 family)
MKDILFINTPISRINRVPDSDTSVPPVGIGYIYTQLTLSGYKCQFIDAAVNSLLPDEIIKIINQTDAKYVGLNIFSSNFGIIRSIVENVEPPTRFFLGGPAVHTLISEIKTWKSSSSIIIVVGEAEHILPKLIENQLPLEKLTDTVSIIYVTPDSPFFPSNIDLPLDRSIFKNEPVQRPDLGLVESHIIASRGCLYNCAFCTAAKSVNPGMKPRYRSYESLAEEIESIHNKHPETNSIRVLDDLFLRNQDSIDLAIRLFPENNLRWRSMAHINTFRYLPSSRLEDIKKSGCQELFIGIESGNDETLKHIRKPFSSNIAFNTISRILDAQIPVKCYFILGLPGETESQLKDTIDFASRLWDYANKRGVQFRISPFRFRPYHGTALYNELLKKGQTVTEIVNRIDIVDTNSTNSYDCVAGIYAEYDENTLNKYMSEMEKLNTYKSVKPIN